MTPLQKKQLRRIAAVGVSAFLLGGLFSSVPVARTVYHAIFDRPFETAAEIDHDPASFALLGREEPFFSFGDRLTGVLFQGSEGEKRGIFVLAHGFGNASHRTYLPLIEALCGRGFLVFAYDSAGVEASESGEGPRGLPRGVMDLESAILHAKGLPEAEELPLYLAGHSWGAYSVGCALSLFPETAGAVLFAGFDRSEDMLLHFAKKYAGPMAYLGYPFIRAYEESQFPPRYTALSAKEGIQNATCPVLIVGAEGDETVPHPVGFDLFRDAFEGNGRVTLLLREGRDHKNLFYSDSAIAHRAALRQRWEREGKKSAFDAYFAAAPDRLSGFEMDGELMAELERLWADGAGEE
jgi:alpha-beta hydrolase superfamily lysophospholipase